MTLQEAKERIKELSDIQMELFDKTYDRKIYGEARAYEEAGHILDEIDTEPVGNPDTLTLTELAHELRKIFNFRCLTVEVPHYSLYFTLWNQKPHWNGKYWDAEMDGKGHIVVDFLEFEVVGKVDISEYKDAEGNIDYSKCIVEVE